MKEKRQLSVTVWLDSSQTFSVMQVSVKAVFHCTMGSLVKTSKVVLREDYIESCIQSLALKLQFISLQCLTVSMQAVTTDN